MTKQEGRIKRHQGRRGRIVGRREVRQRFLIVCEGEQTEPNYFRAFQVPGVVVDIRSTNNRGLDIIDKAIQLRTQDEYDQVWCVFDRDDLPNAIIHQAFNQPRRENINIAFSNQAFEVMARSPEQWPSSMFILSRPTSARTSSNGRENELVNITLSKF